MSMPSQLSGPDLSLLQQPTAPKPAQPGLPAGSLGINLPQLSGIHKYIYMTQHQASGKSNKITFEIPL